MPSVKRHDRKRLPTPFAALAIFAAGSLVAADESRQTVIVVVGAAGADEYDEQFAAWSDRWKQAAEKVNADFILIGRDEDESSDRDRLAQSLQESAGSRADTLWLVLIGHGTFDGREAKFNLRGPDVSAGELAEWLKPLEMPLAVVNCASASGPFINRLSAANRVIVTATKSGYEHNYARFGDYLSRAIADPAADLDKDEQTSLLEAFLAASKGVAEFYEQEARLATEHALLDDNSDALGTPADWFRGVRAIRAAKDGAAADGLRANQFHLVRSPREQSLPPEVRTRRDELELDIARLREQKERLDEQSYYEQLESRLLELARIYESLE